MAELRSSLSAEELLEWSAYFQVEPPESERADARHVIATQYLILAHGGRQVSPDDLAPWTREGYHAGEERMKDLRRQAQRNSEEAAESSQEQVHG